MRILVTGGAGFIGSNFVRQVCAEHADEAHVVNLDALTYAGNLENLADLPDEAPYDFVKGSITDHGLVRSLLADHAIDAIVHFAAESHVDRSIEDPFAFADTNVRGTLTLLAAAREHGVARFVHVSTDEVYGSIPDGKATEESPLAPNSPYAASKAGADHLVRSFWKTYGLPVIITRGTNNYGPYQFPEKMIPLFLTNALEDKPAPLYGDGLQERDWIYVNDHCRALWVVLTRGVPGEIYNIAGDSPRTNIDLTRDILTLLGKPETLIEHVADRPGHDRRYAIDCSKIRRELDWTPQYDMAEGLRRTVDWYQTNRTWWERVKSGEYLDYYKRMYGARGPALAS